jgi:hypothetical protein
MKICARCGTLNVRVPPIGASCIKCQASLNSRGTVEPPHGEPVTDAHDLHRNNGNIHTVTRAHNE